uniref:C2H2-type domain-containing protein n=2 Tax=Timema TaxID=61471 RepID=A0A7R9HS95_9NEOP|nr:unnamed protein product [Timema monikensis]
MYGSGEIVKPRSAETGQKYLAPRVNRSEATLFLYAPGIFGALDLALLGLRVLQGLELEQVELEECPPPNDHRKCMHQLDCSRPQPSTEKNIVAILLSCFYPIARQAFVVVGGSAGPLYHCSVQVQPEGSVYMSGLHEIKLYPPHRPMDVKLQYLKEESLDVGTIESVSKNSEKFLQVDIDGCSDTSSRVSCLIDENSGHSFHEDRIDNLVNSQIGSKNGLPKGTWFCKVCFKTFSQQANLATHERIHRGERPFCCNICLKTFTQQCNLWKHVRTHTGERPFVCKVCHRAFSQQANLAKHMSIHTGERPYQCHFCPKAFTQRVNQVKHERTHTGERPYSCRCDSSKGFLPKGSDSCIIKLVVSSGMFLVVPLAVHPHQFYRIVLTMVQRQPQNLVFALTFCGKRFTQQSNMEKHERVHTGDKPYDCKTCSRSFTQQSNLTKHMAVHYKNKPFRCQNCAKSYTQKSNLLKHAKKCPCVEVT